MIYHKDNMRMQIYFDDETSDFVKKQPKGWVRGLVHEAMGLSETPKSKKAPVEKIQIRPEVLIRPDKPKCRSCGMNLNKFGNCSNLSCKKHL